MLHVPGYIPIIIFAVVVVIDFVLWVTTHRIPKQSEKYWIEAVKKLRPGDFITSWGSGLIGYVIGRLIYLKDGIGDPPNHNMHVHTETTMASAEASGYKIVPLVKRLKECRRFIVYRFQGMHAGQLKELMQLTVCATRKGYDYFWYMKSLLRVMLLFVPLLFVLTTKHAGLLAVIILALYYPVMNVLNRLEKFAAHCSETESMLYRKIGLMKGYEDPTTVAPHNNLEILENMCNVEKVFDSGECVIEE